MRETENPKPVHAPGVLLPTAYLPPLEYMVCIAKTGTALIEWHETYSRQTWRNRCSIATANGRLDLSIPVNRPQGRATKTKEVLISTHRNWEQGHWRAIQTAYGKAPFFLFYRDLFEPFYRERKARYLWDFNTGLLQVLLGQLQLKPRLGYTSYYTRQPGDILDLRERISPKTGRPEGSLLSYWPPYYQSFSERNGFMPNLSVIDLLFHLGPESAAYLRKAAVYLQDQEAEG